MKTQIHIKNMSFLGKILAKWLYVNANNLLKNFEPFLSLQINTLR